MFKFKTDCVNCRKADESACVDYVIVGAGTAGSPLAYWLTNDRKTSVVVIEGGERRNDDPDILSCDADPDVIGMPKYNYFYPQDNADFGGGFGVNGLVSAPWGRLWGGSSGVNSLQCHRGAPNIYDTWATLSGDSRWSYASVLPSMLYLETFTDTTEPVNVSQRGTTGPLFITEIEPHSGPADPFVIQLAANGAPYSPDYNDPDEGVLVSSDLQQYVTPTEDCERSWAASAWLALDVVTAEGRGVGERKLTIRSNTTAMRLIYADESKCQGCSTRRSPTVSSPRVVGVRVIGPTGRVTDILARKEVILSGGAVADPLLLQLSGIGPADVLEAAGVAVRVDNPNVGRNGQKQYAFVASIPADDGDPRIVQSFTDLAGPNTGFPPSGERELSMLWLGNIFGEFITCLCNLMNPARLATVEIQTATFPQSLYGSLTTANVYSTSDERERAVAMLKIIANISLAYAGVLPISPDPSLYPMAEYGANGGMAPNDQALIDWTLDPANQTFGGVGDETGTCQMSIDASTGVVDANLRVHGVRGLSVCSNAVVPRSPSLHLAYSAYVVGLQKAKIEGATVPF